MPGFEVPKFKDGLDSDRYVCERCSLLLKEPIKLRCGHRLCRSCAEDMLAQNTLAHCPRDDCKVTFLQDEHGAPVSQYACNHSHRACMAVGAPFRRFQAVG